VVVDQQGGTVLLVGQFLEWGELVCHLTVVILVCVNCP
jgi:hypothetical protein